METKEPAPPARSAFALEAEDDLRQATPIETLHGGGDITWDVRRGRRSLWFFAVADGVDIAAVRAGYSTHDIGHVTAAAIDRGRVYEFTSSVGAMRVKALAPGRSGEPMRVTTSLLPASAVTVTHWPRDVYFLSGGPGIVHTLQRGLRTGIAYASALEAPRCTIFYFQDFSSLNDYFGATDSTPADTVGGTFPEFGYAPPAGPDRVLPASRETVISDAHVIISPEVPADDGAAAAFYLDALAAVYLHLDHPPTEPHDWPARARQSLRDCSLSPEVTMVRQGRHFVRPYVGDDTKPPESMVQFTLAINATEYDRWRGEESALAAMLRATLPAFIAPDLDTLVRWLPGETFDPSQAEDNMNHDAMDSWYLHHALFNASRIAGFGDADALDAFRRSLPFAMRVARRFDYHWPIFFHLRTLDVVRAESSPGKGGENDVAGLYALVMLRAFEAFGDGVYRDEAVAALQRLEGVGFSIGYQMNTTGFAAEAALRLYRLTGERRYLALSEVCMANLFDNLWLWRCEYGRAVHYRTYLGLFPLHDAPYLAAYEELEAHAKFFDYVPLAGEDLRPSLRLLLGEFQKYSLDRAWFYYPDALPRDGVSDSPRNGCNRRSLSIPLEDLQDGRELSGQVGQEIYGAGLAMIMTTRHVTPLRDLRCSVQCEYGLYEIDIDATAGTLHARVGGDARLTCRLWIVPDDERTAAVVARVDVTRDGVAVPLSGTVAPEGDACFEVRGDTRITIRFASDIGAADDGATAVRISAFATRLPA